MLYKVQVTHIRTAAGQRQPQVSAASPPTAAATSPPADVSSKLHREGEVHAGGFGTRGSEGKVTRAARDGPCAHLRCSTPNQEHQDRTHQKRERPVARHVGAVLPRAQPRQVGAAGKQNQQRREGLVVSWQAGEQRAAALVAARWPAQRSVQCRVLCPKPTLLALPPQPRLRQATQELNPPHEKPLRVPSPSSSTARSPPARGTGGRTTRGRHWGRQQNAGRLQLDAGRQRRAPPGSTSQRDNIPNHPTDAGHRSQVAVLERVSFLALQPPRRRVQHASKVLALLLSHLRSTREA